MKKTAFGIIFLLLAFHMTMMAQMRIVKGSVLDGQTRHALMGVLVGFESHGTTTNANGSFNLVLDTSIHFLQFRLIGYQDTIISIQENQEMIVLMNETSYLLNTSVITASRLEKPLGESSVSISVIKSDLPAKLNSSGVEQLLDRVPGVQIIDGQANIRGGSGYSYGAGSRVLLVMDDLPALVTDAGFPNWDDLPLENIGQIEIVKGAASALYGSSAMNGIIHFRSAYPGSDPITSFTLSSKLYFKPSGDRAWWGKNGNEGSPYEMFFNFVHRKKISSIDYSISGQYNHRIGYNKDDDLKTGRLHALFLKRIHDRFKISLGLNFNKGESSNFFYWKGKGLFEGDPGSASATQKLRFTIDPSVTFQSKSGFHHKLLSRYFYVDNASDNNQSNQSDNIYAEYQLSKIISSIGLQCIGGIVFNPSWTNAALYSDTSFYLQNIAGYLQLEKKFWDRLIISGGMRYERYDSEGPHVAGGKVVSSTTSQDTTIFRLGLNLRINKAGYLRASVGQGFRFPTIAEKYISTRAGGFFIVPNPDLNAEYGTSYEIGIKQGMLLSGSKFLFDAAFFLSRYYDMMEFLLNSQSQFQSINIGNTDIRGIELEVQSITELGNLTITSAGGYTFIEPTYLDFDKTPFTDFSMATKAQLNGANSSSEQNILKYRSKHLFRFDFQLDYQKFYLGVNFNYVSHVHAIDKVFEFLIPGSREYRLEHNTGYRIYDFRAGYEYGHFQFQLNLNNAFNEDYTQRPGLMAAPRNLSLRISYTL